MKLIKLILAFFKNIKPRYQLSLDGDFYNLSTKSKIYRFKVFGDHTFPKFTFNDIINDKRLMYDINPNDLIKIAIDDYINTQNNEMLKVSEVHRDNKFKISDSTSEQVFTGDEICHNLALIEKMRRVDIYRVAFCTGFEQGRELVKHIKRMSENDGQVDNIVTLKVVD